MKTAVAISMIVVLAACSTDAPPPVTQTPTGPTAKGCVDRFVQEYEETAAVAPTAAAQNVCFEGASPEGPPKFPARSLTVRLAYDRGDYFAVQENADWMYDEEPDVARGCVIARLKRTTVIKRVSNGVTESAMTRDGETLRSSVTGEQYGSRIRLGTGPGAMPSAVSLNPATELLREESPYGVCLRAHTVMNSTMCTLEQPRECKSGQVMLPIEIRFPNAQGGTQLGKTTSLERVVANRSEWVLP